MIKAQNGQYLKKILSLTIRTTCKVLPNKIFLIKKKKQQKKTHTMGGGGAKIKLRTDKIVRQPNI